MTKLKVIHITAVDTSLHYLLLHQLQANQAQGYDVVTISSFGKDVKVLEANGIRHIAVHITRKVDPFRDLISLFQLWNIIRTESAAIVHTHTPKPGLLGQIAARFARAPIVINTVHGFYFHDNMPHFKKAFYVLMEKVAAMCSDVILSQNREDIQTALREKICSSNKIKFIGNGIDLNRFSLENVEEQAVSTLHDNIGIPKDVPIVGFVGRLAGKRKGFTDFLTAAKIVLDNSPKTRFLIIGESDFGKADAVDPNIVVEMGISDAFHFVGQQPNHLLPLFYRIMTILVLPSEFEGFPRVIMEASAMGVPVVATDVKGNREAVHVDQNGLLTPYGKPKVLAHTIITLLRDSAKLSELQHNGPEIASKHFDEQVVFEKIKQEYVRLLREKGLS